MKGEVSQVKAETGKGRSAGRARGERARGGAPERNSSSGKHGGRGSAATLGVVTVVLTLAGWSSVPLFLRHFSEDIDSWTSNGWRYGFSALVWLPVVLGALVKAGLPRGIWRAALVPGAVNAAGQVCFTQAHYMIDPALLTFGLRCQLVFVAIGAWLMFPKERAIIRTPGFVAGAGLLIAGMVGVVLMGEAKAGVATGVRGTQAGHAMGVGLAVGSGMLFAAYGLSVRKYMAGLNPVLAFGVICQYTAGVMVLLMVVFGERSGQLVLEMSGEQVVMLLISAVVGIAIGHVFYYISIARLGVAVTAGVLQLQPFLVAIGSLHYFGERLSGPQWGGGVAAVAGALLMLWVQWRVSRARHVPSEKELGIAEGESGG